MRGASHEVAAACLLPLLLLLLPPERGAAQTGLLVLGGEEARVVAEQVRWTAGPVAWAAALEGAGLDGVAGDRVPRWIVVALEGRGAPAPDANVEIRVEIEPDPAATARRIERRAADALRDLEARDPPGRVFHLAGVNVIGVRTPLETFGTPAPVTVVDESVLERRGWRGPLDPLRSVPGVELDGVGAARTQPVVRGFGGQRVLLMEDGLRLANSRRRLDSVEPAALVGIGTVERVEIVRGPASVLYGSDAIGGVVNLVTRGPTPGDGFDGRVDVSASTAGGSGSATVSLEADAGPAAVRVSVGGRDAGSYEAPSGSFGGVSLPDGARVHDTGVRDRHARARVDWPLARGGSAFLGAELYQADGSGFGFVDPERLGDDPTRVRLTFPDHRYRRVMAGWRGRDLGLGVADGLDVTLHLQDNERDFVTDVLAPMRGAPPDARLDVRTLNRTDLTTLGARVEASATAGASHLVTWGLDAYRDRSRGADTTTTTISGLGPDRVTVRTSDAVPDATLTSVGLFLQDRWVVERATELTLGARWQRVRAEPDGVGGIVLDGGADDPGDAHVDQTLVGSLGAVRRLGPDVALVASVARGFRSPNLVERFYSGPTPGGQGTWVRNPDLAAETGLTVDVGVRVRRGPLQGEAFVHRTALSDGIRLEPTGHRTEGGVPEYRNENVESLVVRGVEAWAAWSPGTRWTVTGSLDLRDTSRPADPDDPLVEGTRLGLGAAVRHETVPDRLTLEYAVRWRDARREPLGAGSPVGEDVPAWAVHDLWADASLTEGVHLTLGVENLLDALYAVPGNAVFFRPEPGRTLVARVTSRF